MLVLIPAYEPDLRLLTLVRELRATAPEASVLVVDDGSGPAYRDIFEICREAGAALVSYPDNRGKGVALKRGFAWASEQAAGEDVVCADADGQHAVRDIVRVGVAIAPGTMVLGGRRFTGAVPWRSRVGNAVSRGAFRLVMGVHVHDTQTGLRGYPADLLGWLSSVEGERFEYESNLLFEARAAGVAIEELPIETIYLDENASSHFRPVADSLRIYSRLLGFAASSLVGAGIDWVGVLLLNALTGNLLAAVVGARVLSAWANYSLNRAVVFGAGTASKRALRRYLGLAAVILAANYLGLAVLTGVGLPLVLAKLLVETVLFAASYVAQRRYVFAGSQATRASTGSAVQAAPVNMANSRPAASMR